MSTIPEEIIIRSIRKTATPEEQEILNRWLKEDRKNVEQYFRLEEIWHLGKQIPGEIIARGWNRLTTEIEKSPSDMPDILLIPKQKKFGWLRYIAAVFIGIGIATAVWMNMPSEDDRREESVLVQNVVYNRIGVHPVLLPDGSEVWVNEDTRFSYPEKFTDGRRLVSLEGKAYFDIRKNEEEPFIVRIGTVDVEVTGTEFFIESVREEETLVTLVSGGVTINYVDTKGNKQSASLTPGRQAVIDRGKGEVDITEVDTYYYIVWKDGVYRFDDEPLETIAGLLSQRLDWDIRIAPSLKDKRFTGRVTSEESIEDVMTSLSQSYSLKYQITGKTIKISGT